MKSFYQMLATAKSEEELNRITEDQKKMLDMSHQDILNNNLFPEDELNLRDKQWLNEK